MHILALTNDLEPLFDSRFGICILGLSIVGLLFLSFGRRWDLSDSSTDPVRSINVLSFARVTSVIGDGSVAL